ncbi:hypothetical protein [Allosphingosinicella humi]
MKKSVFASVTVMAAVGMTMAASPAEASRIALSGHVQTICEMRYELLSGASAETNADLVIFCNAPQGAVVSATLVDGHEDGYTLFSRAGSFVATPGSEVEIQNYTTAFAGREHVRIAQISADAPVAPTLVFEITLE